MTIIALGLAALIATGAAAPAASPDTRTAGASAPADLQTLNTRLQEQLRTDNYLGALATLKLMEAHPDFPLMPENGRTAVELLLGVLHGDQGAWAVARPYLERVVTRPNAPPVAWESLLTAQAATGDMNAAARTLTQVATRHPPVLEGLRPDFVESLAGWRDVDADTAFALRLALHRANWNSDHDSHLWLKLVDDLITRDRLAEAAQVAPKIDGFGSRLTLFSLRRYDALRAAAVWTTRTSRAASSAIRTTSAVVRKQPTAPSKPGPSSRWRSMRRAVTPTPSPWPTPVWRHPSPKTRIQTIAAGSSM